MPGLCARAPKSAIQDPNNGKSLKIIKFHHENWILFIMKIYADSNAIFRVHVSHSRVGSLISSLALCSSRHLMRATRVQKRARECFPSACTSRYDLKRNGKFMTILESRSRSQSREKHVDFLRLSLPCIMFPHVSQHHLCSRLCWKLILIASSA